MSRDPRPSSEAFLAHGPPPYPYPPPPGKGDPGGRLSLGSRGLTDSVTMPVAPCRLHCWLHSPSGRRREPHLTGGCRGQQSRRTEGRLPRAGQCCPAPVQAWAPTPRTRKLAGALPPQVPTEPRHGQGAPTLRTGRQRPGGGLAVTEPRACALPLTQAAGFRAPVPTTAWRSGEP